MPLSKAEFQALVASDDRVILFKNPKNKRSECWTNYSQIYHGNSLQDYIICVRCKPMLKRAKDHGIRVMIHRNCFKNKSTLMTPSQQRTISSHYTQSSSSKECLLIEKRITKACVKYCAVDGHLFENVADARFQNLAKQLISAGATLATAIHVSDLLPHPSTVNTEPAFHKRSNYDIN